MVYAGLWYDLRLALQAENKALNSHQQYTVSRTLSWGSGFHLSMYTRQVWVWLKSMIRSTSLYAQVRLFRDCVCDQTDFANYSGD